MSTPDEIHKSEVSVPSKQYPDVKTAVDAMHEFRARVRAMADEMGIHAMLVVAEFTVQEQKPADCVIAYGCMPCCGIASARCISALMEDTPDFGKGYIAATMVEATDMARSVIAMRQAQKEGYQA